jgi:alkylated DNA repair protein alkB family protein 8
LALLNVGLKNGIQTEILTKSLEKLQDIILPPNKSYCFFKFESASDAEVAFNSFLGKSLWTDCAPLLVSFCKELPPITRDESERDPEGLILLEDFITQEMESVLISLIKCEDNKMKNRHVEHFGFEFIYGSNSVDHNNPLERKIPNECDELWTLFDQRCPVLAGFRPDQLTVNQYQPGQGIPSHCDTHSIFEDAIISLSLGSSIVMEFKNPQTGEHLSKLLPRRSLLIMTGESRFGWTHGIVPKVSDIVKSENGFLTVQSRQLRHSFTFRK